jgi:GNAT superfamily N-acetyltransferase
VIIRAAEEKDLPAILELFKASLGEEGGIPEESFWKWKHHHNPFGASPTLLAFEENTLIGLRTFLRWRFFYRKKVFQAYRAVDTATHPAHQGKGIFTKLTLALLDQVRKGEPSIIYNTPNEKSLPGYRKMGWEILEKTPLHVQPRPMNMVLNRLTKHEPDIKPLNWSPELQANIAEVLPRWRAMQTSIITDYSPAYLQWRYAEIPGFSYGAESLQQGESRCVLFYRIKQSGKVTEARINEVFYCGHHASKLIREGLRNIRTQYRPDVITVLTDSGGELKNRLPFGFFDATNRGLIITWRSVNSEELDNLVKTHANWFFSSGTLELF